ncbi:hypothetical protein NEISICOT_02265 [Neisseria sicca ATCC 29256]|uniref:Uncharacterized protein n=1 Tax=Neisseria sicca ATCC 29256 TaxID=547045 RepID=C6M6W2_NEISI|nr:hypothetical protein NEISICOT_02265 [Neisseria sicca ATCC 29256]
MLKILRSDEERSSENGILVSDDLLLHQQSCSFPRPAGEG